MDVVLPSGVTLKNIPDGTSKDEIKRKAISAGLAKESDFSEQTVSQYSPIQQKLIGAIAEKEGISDSEAADRLFRKEGFSLHRAISNIPESAVQYAKDVATPLVQPVTTAKSIGNLALGVGEKLIPGEQEHEPYADAVGQFFADRYGSVDAFLKTAEKDPVGVIGDLSTILTGGGLKAGKIGKIGQGINPVNVVRGAVTTPVKTLASPDKTRKMYDSAAKFSTTKTPGERASLINTAMKEGIMPTYSGAEKAREIIQEINTQISDLISEATSKGTTIPKSRLFQYLKEARKKAGGAKIEGAKDLKQINQVAKAFDELLKENNKAYLTPKELQDFKTDVYKRINFARSNQKAKPGKEIAYKAMARAAKVELEKLYPEIKNLNRRDGDLIELLEHVERSAARIANRDIAGIGIPLKTSAGGIIGGPEGAIVGTLTALLDTPKIKAKLAMVLDKARNSGYQTSRATTAAANASFQAGRAQNQALGGD